MFYVTKRRDKFLNDRKRKEISKRQQHIVLVVPNHSKWVWTILSNITLFLVYNFKYFIVYVYAFFKILLFARGECDEVFDVINCWFFVSGLYSVICFRTREYQGACPSVLKCVIALIELGMRFPMDRERWTFRSRGLEDSDFSSRWGAEKALLSFPSASRNFLAPRRAYGFILFIFGKVRGLLYASQEHRQLARR